MAPAQTFTEFSVPSPRAGPLRITAGPDGNVWFTEINSSGPGIGRITPEGVITEFRIPSPGARPLQITTGPDGNLWFTESASSANRIGRVTPDGSFTEFPIPTPASEADGIATGPDGALWFTEHSRNKIGRITTSGAITEFVVPTSGARLEAIVTGSDGALWFAERNANKIGRITTSGEITEFPIPTPFSEPIFITAGPDGALWFGESSANKIGRITTSGEITEFPIPTPDAQPYDIVAGIDGNLYFAEWRGNKIGRITTSGVITEFPVPTPGSLQGIASGPDGAIWFTNFSANKIGRLSIGPPTEPGPVSVTLPAAASLHGAGATFFHSDVSVFNPSATQPATVTARYRCFTGACGSSVQTFPLSPRQMRVFEDIVGTLFGAAGTGGAVEFSGNVLVDSRLYTPSRPAPTVGMYVPGLSAAEAYADAVLTSLSYSANLSTGFRTNVGAYNGNDVAQTVTFTLYNPQGVQIGQTAQLIPGRTPVQINNIAGFVGITADVPSFYCVVRGDGTSKLYVYAAVLDNQSQDLIFVKGANNAAVPAGLVTLPAAASLHGAPPTFFHSDVSVFNPSATQSATVTARYRCFTGACGNAVQSFTVPPRQIRIFDDIVGTLFGAAETGGAVEFSGNVLVDSRLYTPSRPAPTVGMYVAGLSAAEAYAEAVVTSLSFSANLSAGFRTNVGVYNGNDVAQMVTFTLFNPQGVQIGQTVQLVPARTPLQINNIAGFVGIATDVPSFYCVVRGDGTSKLYVYAAVLDNQSQDLIFVKGAESRSP